MYMGWAVFKSKHDICANLIPYFHLSFGCRRNFTVSLWVFEMGEKLAEESGKIPLIIL